MARPKARAVGQWILVLIDDWRHHPSVDRQANPRSRGRTAARRPAPRPGPFHVPSWFGGPARLAGRAARCALAGLIAASAALAPAAAAPVRAAGLTVDSTADAADANPGDGICATASGACTLRAAIQEANALSGADTVTVPAGTYRITIAPGTVGPVELPGDGTPCNAVQAGDHEGDLDITCPISIVGAGAGQTVIEAGDPPVGAPPEQTALDRVLEIHAGAGAVTLSGVTVRRGYHPEAGGAIANSSGGTVRLVGVEVSDSAATTFGGGIYSGVPLEVECPEPCAGGAPRLEIVDSTVSGNSTGGVGGGIYVQLGSLTVTGGTISENQAGSGGGLFNAGELSPTGIPSTVALTNVSITGNVAFGAGGGVFGDHEGSITVTGGELAGNLAHDYGGGLAVVSKSSLAMSGTTVSGNRAHTEGGGVRTDVERTVAITGTTFSANEAGATVIDPDTGLPEEGDGGGGGLQIAGSGPASVANSTFVGNTAVGEGGGVLIENNGSVAIRDSVIRDNTSGGGGGGIENGGMNVTFTRLTIAGNRTTLDGGGIESNGSGVFTVIDTSIFRNTAENGGGFANQADGLTLFRNTTIWDNRALIGENDDTGLGGGIYGLGDADQEYENVTISANFAQVRGGGLYIDADADAHVTNSTISRNVAPAASGVGDEGTSFNFPIVPSLSVVFRNTIVAGNLLSPSCNFALGSAGGNLEDGDSCTFRGARDRTNADPGLDAIADNGGPTLTMALREGSPAIDGAVAPCPATDQRGVIRPVNVTCDVGAFEYEGPFGEPDTTPPDTTYLTGPVQDTLVTSSFTFTGVDETTPSDELLFECRLLETDPTEPPEPVDPTEPVDPLDPAFMWHGCPSPWQVPLIEEGLFRFEVRAIDRTGNVDPTPDVHVFGGTLDFNPPDTFFTGTPTDPSGGTVAVFGFSGLDDSTPPQFLEYECRIDSLDPAAWLECTSPAVFTNLAAGSHTVQVRAADGNDNVDPSPASFTWTVGAPTTCEQANITLFATADSWVDELLPLENFGTAIELIVRSGTLDGNARTLVRFGVPTTLPAGCDLASARLRLFSEGAAGRTLEAVPLGEAWLEGSVTWANQPSTTGSPATTTSGNGYREWDVTGHVGAMLAGDLADHGWLVRDAQENDEAGAEQSITSRNLILDPPETQVPQLVLRFDGPTEPPPDAADDPTPAFVTCGTVLTESTLVMNDLVDCPFDGLVVGAPDIIVDLGGHTIDGLNYLLSGEETGLPAGIRNIGHRNVHIRNGTVQEFGQGVQIMAGATYNVVEELVIASNAVAGVELWDADDGRAGNTIRNNAFVGNGEAGVLLLSGTEAAIITGNTFDGNAGMAVHLIDSSGALIEGNHVSGVPVNPALDSDGGFLLEGSSDVVIRGNTLAETGDAGVVVSLGSHRSVIDGNVMTRTGDAGVSISDSDFVTVTGNVAHLGSDAGVVLTGVNDALVADNDVRFNPTGIDLSGANRVTIERNNADFAHGAGIAIGSGSFQNVVRDNDANFTRGDGIVVESDAVDAAGVPDPIQGTLIVANVANGNLGSGIAVHGAGHTIADNTTLSNAAWGIDAAAGNVDGGGNVAAGNAEPPQCTGVVCLPGTAVTVPGPDFEPPDTFLSTTPPNPHGMLDTVSFTFGGTDNVAPPTALRFECRLDAPPDPPVVPNPELEPPEPGDPTLPEGAEWHECANPVTFRLLTTGDHTFEVRAIDPFDNVDPTAATFTWTVLAMPPGADSLAPSTRIIEGPADPSTSPDATIRFGGSDNVTEGPNLTYTCWLDGAPAVPCTSPFSATGLGLGEHTFAVVATDLAGNTDPTPAIHNWTIEEPPPDVVAPDTTIDSGPDPTTVQTTAAFAFSSNEGVVSFECDLDSEAYAPCSSPVEVTGLSVGDHTFAVRAIDLAGNEDPTPAVLAWTVGPAPVPTAIGCGQVVTDSILVTNDLFECPADGLVVGAPSITIDLNGHTIDGLTAGTGIANDGHDSVTVTNGTVSEFEIGIRLGPGTSRGIVSDVQVSLGEAVGILLTNAHDGPIGNTIRRSTIAGGGDGIVIIGGTQGTHVHDNTIGGNALNGVVVTSSARNIVERTDVTGSGGAGIVLTGASLNRVAENTVRSNGSEAVAVTALSNGNVIVDNVLGESAGGIQIVDSIGNELIGNVAQGMGGPGIVLENAHDGIVRSNDVRFNSGGIQLLRASGNRIEANEASETDGAGISLGDVSLNNVVVLNTASFNASEGIVVGDPAGAGSGNLIDRNTTSNNVADGIHVGAVGHIIVGNIANSNGGWGIYAALATVAGINVDGGGNRAVGNGELFQCFGVVCDGSAPLSADPLAPETTIIDGPAASTVATSATFRFTGFDNATGVTFECRLDSTDAGDFAPCSSPYSIGALAIGPHTFDVRARDFSGNVDPTPANHSWTISALPPGVPPDTTIDSGPDATTVSTSATFTFSSNEPGTTFECSLDTAPFTSCASPLTLTGLGVGPHHIDVRAVDVETLVDPTPASYDWTVGDPPLESAVSCGQVITQSVRLTNDLLNCAVNGLVVGASGITIDLDGHTIDGIGGGAGVLNAGSHDMVTIMNGTISEFDVGVQLNAGADDGIASSLVLLSNEVAGVQVGGGDGTIVRDTEVTGNGTGILVLAGSAGTVIAGATVSGSLLDGIRLDGATGTRIENAAVGGSSELGLAISASTGSIVADSTFTANSGGGIGIELASHDTRLETNLITGSGSTGIAILDSDGTQLIGNTVQQSGSVAVDLSAANDGVIQGNDLRFNADGLALFDSSGNLIELNNTSANSSTGIEIEGASFDNVVRLNLATGNAGDGISSPTAVSAGSGNLFEANTASSNGGDGIFVAAGHTVTANTVNFNDGWGILAEPGSIDGGGNQAVGNSEPLQCSGVVCVIGVNPGAPDTTILDRPADPSESAFATFTFVGTDDTTALIDLDFECRLDTTDELAWVACENPQQFGPLAAGSHTFEVRSVDLQGNVDPTPATFTWAHDPLPTGVAPDTLIDVGPPLASPLLEVFFQFSATEPDVTFECSLDGGPFEPCADTPEMIAASFFVAVYQFEETDVGTHTFAVRATDLEGNTDLTPATYTWTILGLLTTVTAGPAFEPGEGTDPATGGETDSTTATFDFGANIADATFVCSLDLGPFEPCEPGVTYTDLAVGEHSFQVLATDPEGEFSQPEATVYEWTIILGADVTAPQTTITIAPADGTSETVFAFSGTDDQTPPALLEFECRLDSTSDVDWFGCLSPFLLVVEFPELAPGSHTFEVRAIDGAEPDPNIDSTPAVHTWTSVADTVAPDTAITGGPASPTIESDAAIPFSGSDAVTPADLLTFECSFDGSDFVTCEAPFQAQGTLPGDHELAVRAVDIALNADPTPATFTWTVIGPPDTTITSGPDAVTADASVTLIFSADQAGSTFTCSLNGATAVPCTSPLVLDGIGGGSFTIAIAATNTFGLVEVDRAVHAWSSSAPTDSTNPETTITSTPAAANAPQTASFSFASSELGSSFQCALDGGGFTSCTSPATYAGLFGGDHVFEVRATDLAGNVDPTPAQYAWDVLGPPVTTVVSGPEDVTENTSATFTFSSSASDATFMCALDVPPFAPCTSPVTYTGLTAGPHVFAVYSIADGLIDTDGADWEWTVLSAVPPETSLVDGPTGTTLSTSQTLTFISSEPGTFECSVDGGAFASCTSPVELAGLTPGTHSFAVQAIDLAGNVDPSAATATWTVVEPDTQAPETTVDSGPTGTTTDTSATFTFSASEAATFECALDGAPFAGCTSPLTLTGLPIGEHSLAVRATDGSANADATPATYAWSIVAPPPNCGSSVTLTASADSWIDQGSPSNGNGSDSTLKVMSKGPSSNLRALVRFTMPAIPAGCVVDTATLRLFAASTSSGRTLQAIRVAGTWAEGSANWSNQPATAGPAATTTSGTGYRQWNVQALVQSMYDTGGLHGFLVRDAAENGDAEQQFNSREKGSNPPQLVLSFKPAPVPDTAAPDTMITGMPAAPAGPSGTFTFDAVDDRTASGSFTFECSLDGAAFAACANPWSYGGASVGEHVLGVRAMDQAGNVDPTPASHTWMVEPPPPDTTPPDTTIGSGPPATTTGTTATFAFTSTEADSTFECSLDGSAYAACTSPTTLSGLSDAAHEFRVRAIDAAGNADPGPAIWTWTISAAIDCGGPITVTASADAWVDQGSRSNNLGSDSILKVQAKSSTNYRALVRFELPTSPVGCVVQSAALRLFAASASSNRTLQALQISGSWTESGVTWNNQPGTTGSAATVSSGIGWRQWSVTAQVQAMYAPSANDGFLIRDASEGGSGREQQFHAREKGSNIPTLIVTFGPG